ncbi:transcriptional regulator [Neorhizobium alkalisoli]|uniref:Uncharacterized protein n=1 Tax=Neorhizobium alkalisoli TaxID=528178 RepID=A0A561R422_9HYPH|nr:transcriptional regulator [Neorhizobium alkalisoli]TWF57354.1 hypothetical protein FHW37_102997 [Neorhizobium alkalisoli]
MQADETISVKLELPIDTLKAFDEIAAVLGTDKQSLMSAILADYISQGVEEILEEAEGVAALDRGEGTDLDDFLGQARSIVEAAEAKRTRRAG